MKTTVEITDSLLAEARRLAAARSTTLRQIIEEGLRKVIETKPKQPFRLRDGSFGSGGMRRKMTWDEIRGEAYQGRGA
jgi:Bacterial antitoxin of type II TA system, VapB